MKKSLIIIACFFTTFSFAQTKVSLDTDPIFIETLQKQEEISNILMNSLGQNQEAYDLAKNEIEAYQKTIAGDKSVSNEVVIQKLSSILKLPSNVNFNNYIVSITSNLEKLKTQYGENFNEANIKSSIENYNLTNVAAKLSPRAAYTACSVGVFTAAALAYGGCLTTIFGAPLCFALVATGQTAGIALCAHNYL